MTIDESRWNDFQRRLERLERQRRATAFVGPVVVLAALLGGYRLSNSGAVAAAPATDSAEFSDPPEDTRQVMTA